MVEREKHRRGKPAVSLTFSCDWRTIIACKWPESEGLSGQGEIIAASAQSDTDE
ncbi:hypothetical protein AC28_1567 [Escherichia coli 1-250-04_S3_C2]|nr:hypothetical protein AC28_1567 [Escherichia coli 1-250-04_S3_C2]